VTNPAASTDPSPVDGGAAAADEPHQPVRRPTGGWYCASCGVRWPCLEASSIAARLARRVIELNKLPAAAAQKSPSYSAGDQDVTPPPGGRTIS
jgi:hypothetical protein